MDHLGDPSRPTAACTSSAGPTPWRFDDPHDGALVGGLYGVHVGGLFAGESMFHRATDASKVALVALVERLGRIGVDLLDVQWLTPHLASLGAIEIPRSEYLRRLEAVVTAPTGSFPDEPVLPPPPPPGSPA